jgi:galactonate dehydratase
MSLVMARRTLPLLEPAAPLFVEEPVVPEVSELVRQLAAATPSRSLWASGSTAGGTSVASSAQGSRSSSPTWHTPAGSPRSARSPRWAEACDVALAPHCPLGPIALAASLQVGLASPDLLIQEQSLGIRYNAEFAEW